MNALLKRNFVAPALDSRSIELRQHVERLEQLREEACRQRDRDAVAGADELIEAAVKEWMASVMVQSKRAGDDEASEQRAA